MILDLKSLVEKNSVSPCLLLSHAEAASVMLWKFKHAPEGTAGEWARDSAGAVDFTLVWVGASDSLLNTYGNEKDATEEGAYAVAIALVNAIGFKVIARTFQGSHCDWVMVPTGEPANDYHKLEVSGMARAGREMPEARLAEKVEQGSGGDWERPGTAVVVRFEDVRVLSKDWR